ncbi:hypothetical protein GCM10011607_28260 [Shewanella inventionis]|uniref:Uncharacterized protein n=1 Tax=Shewanella inventionis TaxID=1738770 RepID=A0ABQ1JFG5_9GAMM|nr:hypothetical protein [Shewanella inventionis]GGB65893.1 hypothetical protein GCM10011607_28260 [Shewanella inventionis]
MDEELLKSDPNEILLEHYGEKLQSLTPKESQSVYVYTMLTDWVTKLIVAQVADWKVTPVGHVLCCNKEVSETLGYDTDDGAIVVPESLEWFSRVSWLECRVVNNTILLKKLISFQCFWIQLAITPELSELLLNKKSLVFRVASDEGNSNEVPLFHASLDANS